MGEFAMNTELIPAGVDLELAGRRSKLIEAWRAGQASAEDTYYDLEKLYWDTQQSTNGETNVYLRQSAYQFPVEAGMSLDEADAIIEKARKDREGAY